MRLRPFGPDAVMVPVIGQGTWMMERDPAESVAALRKGLELGMTHIDTAEMYGRGAVERIVGRAIAGRRDEVFLVTKVLPQNATYQGTIEACEASLQRLGTDHLDVYLLHSPSFHPIEETCRAFGKLVEDGKIAAYGVSNFDPDLLDEAVAAARPRDVACDQVLYHLKDRWIEHGLIEHCQPLGIAVVGYSPYGQGHFPDHPVLHRIAADHRATARQVALAFLLRLPGTFVIPKAASVAHVEENGGAGDLELDPEEVALIDDAFPIPPLVAGLPRL